jgi:hypothetical protein
MMDTILRPVIIKLGEHNYYNTKDLQIYDPIYFHGCSRGVRKILEKKTIEVSKYKYATWCKKNNWKLSANQIKPSTKASLLLDETWVIENIPKMMPNSNKTKYEYEEAPKIIHLEDEEKFKDDEGKHVDIETRGYRSHSGIYFLAKDVATAFEMPSLVKNVHESTNTQYIINEHYKTFVCNRRKLLFLTYIGMLKIIFNSRNLNTKLNILVLMNWVQNVAGICQLLYKPYLLNLNKSIGFKGIVYFASCDILNGIKIGFWRSSLISLKKRYATTYGKDVEIIFFRTNNAPKLEKDLHTTFKEYNLTNEIFRKDNLNNYLDYIREREIGEIQNYNDCSIYELLMKPTFELIYDKSIKNMHIDNNCIIYEENAIIIENLKKDILMKDKEINLLSEKHDLELKLKDEIIKNKDLKIELLELKLSIK